MKRNESGYQLNKRGRRGKKGKKQRKKALSAEVKKFAQITDLLSNNAYSSSADSASNANVSMEDNSNNINMHTEELDQGGDKQDDEGHKN